MPITTIYIARHGYRLNWLSEPHPPSPTGIEGDLPLAPHGHVQANELASFINSLSTKPQFIISSPFYQCIQTALPTKLLLDIPLVVDRGVGEFYNIGTPLYPTPASFTTLNKLFPDLSPWTNTITPHLGESPNLILSRCNLFLSIFIPHLESLFPHITSILIITHADTAIALGMALLGKLSVFEEILLVDRIGLVGDNNGDGLVGLVDRVGDDVDGVDGNMVDRVDLVGENRVDRVNLVDRVDSENLADRVDLRVDGENLVDLMDIDRESLADKIGNLVDIENMVDLRDVADLRDLVDIDRESLADKIRQKLNLMDLADIDRDSVINQDSNIGVNQDSNIGVNQDFGSNSINQDSKALDLNSNSINQVSGSNSSLVFIRAGAASLSVYERVREVGKIGENGESLVGGENNSLALKVSSSGGIDTRNGLSNTEISSNDASTSGNGVLNAEESSNNLSNGKNTFKSFPKPIPSFGQWNITSNGNTLYLAKGEEMNWNFHSGFEAGSDEDIKSRREKAEKAGKSKWDTPEPEVEKNGEEEKKKDEEYEVSIL